MPPATDVAVGLVLDGRYRLDEAIGHGGMATVYRAWDTTLGRDVALKLFPPTPDEDEALRFDAEIGFLAQLSHPNLVALYDGASAPVENHVPRSYIVMELVAGPTLADLLAEGPLSADRVTRIGSQLADALAYVHAAQVVHRDVKPANVLGVYDAPDGDATRMAVKLADFGIARLIDADRVTRTGTTLGTATYLSPEQAAGEAVGPPTDVYALGLVLLECLTGRKAFTGTFAEVAAARLATDPPIPDEVGAAWRALLRDMTRRDPAERVTMADAAARLSLLDDGLGAVSVELGMLPRATRHLPIAPATAADPGPGAEEGAAGAGAGDRRSDDAGAAVLATRTALEEAADAGQVSAARYRLIEDALLRVEVEVAALVAVVDAEADPAEQSDPGSSDSAEVGPPEHSNSGGGK